jgi:hypothetical protein
MRPASIIVREVDRVIVRVCVQQSQRRLTDGQRAKVRGDLPRWSAASPLGTARKGTVGVSVFNAYNRQNVWYKEFTLLEGEVVENEINLMNLTLNAFFTIKF